MPHRLRLGKLQQQRRRQEQEEEEEEEEEEGEEEEEQQQQNGEGEREGEEEAGSEVEEVEGEEEGRGGEEEGGGGAREGALASSKSKGLGAQSIDTALPAGARAGWHPSFSLGNHPSHRASGIRVKRALLAGRRGGGPSTPIPGWKMFENPLHNHMDAAAARHQPGKTSRRITVSARKLAATLWELQEIPLSRAAANKIQTAATQQQPQHQQLPSPPRLVHRNSGGRRNALHGQFAPSLSPASSHTSQRSIKRSSIQWKFGDGAKRHSHASGHAPGARFQVLKLLEKHGGPRTAQITDSSHPREVGADDRAITPSNSVLDMRAMPGDPGYGPTTSSELLKVLNRIWSLEEQHSSSMSMVAALRSELNHARLQVQELTLEQKSHRKEVESLTRRLTEEKVVWRDQEQGTIRAVVQSIKEELEDERKSKRRVEMLHRKVARELTDVKGTLVKALQELERERKARELMEDVCDELAREIGEDKAKVEELRLESAKVREEVEEERKMLQMAEVWREERVQMKLAEARLELEEKNTALDKLRSELEAFLKAKRAGDARDEGRSAIDMKESDPRRSLVDSSHLENARVNQAHSEESRVLGRSTVESVRGNETRTITRNAQESDDEGSIDDDLHSIELNNESYSANAGSNQWVYQSGSHQEAEGKGRKSFDRRIMAVDRLQMGKQHQGGKTQTLERRMGSQLDAGNAAIENRDTGGHWDYMHESQWIERSIEKGEMREWNHEKRFLSDAKQESKSPWQSDQEESQEHITFNLRKGRNLQGHSDSFARSGGAPYGGTGLKYEGDARLESYGSNTGPRFRSFGASRDLRSNSGFTSVQQSSHITSSPTRQWSHYWSSPDPGSPRLGRSNKGPSEVPKSARDNSLKAKLLEAKLEGQQSRSRGGKGL